MQTDECHELVFNICTFLIPFFCPLTIHKSSDILQYFAQRIYHSLNKPFFYQFFLHSPVSCSLWQGVNSMFQVFLTGNNSEYFTISPTAVQGRADIRMRVAVPLDFENIRSYSFSVSLKSTCFQRECWGGLHSQTLTRNIQFETKTPHHQLSSLYF